MAETHDLPVNIRNQIELMQRVDAVGRRRIAPQDWRVLARYIREALAAPSSSVAPPSIDCPLCGKQVDQVASATLSIALWQHTNWACEVVKAHSLKAAAVAPPCPSCDGLLAERDRLRAALEELTSALAAIHTAGRDDAKEEWWSLRRWCDKRNIFNDDIQGGMRLVGIVAKEALARFKKAALAASPTAPEGTKE